MPDGTNSFWEDIEYEGPVLAMTKEALIRQYLLGNLPQDKREQLEDQYFADTEIFEELVAVEYDLIDAYVRRELSPSEQKQFETQYFSSPQRRARVDFARCLDRARSELSARPNKGQSAVWRFGFSVFSRRYLRLQWASVAAALILAVAGSWLLLQNHRLRMQVQEAQKQHQAFPTQLGAPQEQPQAHSPSIAARNSSESQNSARSTTVATLDLSRQPSLIFTLSSGAVRGAETGQKDLVIPSTIASVILRLPISMDAYGRYEANLQSAEGRKIQASEGLTSQKLDRYAVVLFRIPSTRLKPGDYIVRLSGRDETGGVREIQAYSFRVLER